MRTLSIRHYAGSFLFIGLSLTVHHAGAQNAVQYLSSSTGFVLHRSGNTAVVSQWQGQKPIARFSGYGQISMDNLCLTGNNGEKPLTWEACRNDPGQRWGLENGRLRNERGWCADLEGGRGGANVRVVAWKCNGQGNQMWKPHYAISSSNYVSKIPDPNIRQTLNTKIGNASAGQVIPLTQPEKNALIAAGASDLIGLDGATLISAGGRGLISAGGLGFQR